MSQIFKKMMLKTMLLMAMLALSFNSFAAEVQVAVAANFAEPMKAITVVFEKTTGHKVLSTIGATGKFYAQIKNAAPFDVFLSADSKTPELLEMEGLAVKGSRFTYATGKLVLWSADASVVDAKGDVLKRHNFRKIAYASPKLAPYGAAAEQVIDKLGLTNALASKVVQGESLAQTYNFVHTGNAELGFVALSQVLEGGKLKNGSVWRIPQDLYSPIKQDAVLLQRGANNPAALALIQLLKSSSIKDLLRSYGYDV